MKPRNNHPTRLWGSAWSFPTFVILLFGSMAFIPATNRTGEERELQTAFELVCLERASIDFTVEEEGVIFATAEWTPQGTPAALILYGPGQMNYYERKEGKGPLKVEFTVTARHLARGTDWSIAVLNQKEEKISGMLLVRFPGKDPKAF